MKKAKMKRKRERWKERKKKEGKKEGKKERKNKRKKEARANGKEIYVYELSASISYGFNPLCIAEEDGQKLTFLCISLCLHTISRYRDRPMDWQTKWPSHRGALSQETVQAILEVTYMLHPSEIYLPSGSPWEIYLLSLYVTSPYPIGQKFYIFSCY